METKYTTLPLMSFFDYIKKGKIKLNKFLEKEIVPIRHKEKTIYWLLKGYPLPNNIVIDNDGNIISDKETIKIINEFFNDELEIKGYFLNKIKSEILTNYNEEKLNFSKLPIEVKEKLNNFQITYSVVYFPNHQELEEYKKILKR